jgi:hypothetical protein
MNSFFRSAQIVALILFVTNFLSSQSRSTYDALNEVFTSYDVVTIDASQLYQRAKAKSDLSNFVLDLGNGSTYRLNLSSVKIVSDRFVTREQISPTEIKTTYGTNIVTLRGEVNKVPNSKVALTLNDNYIYGYIKIGYNEYFIEPVYHLAAERTINKFVWYNAKDIIKKEAGTCAADAMEKYKSHYNNEKTENVGSRSVGECFELDYNFASDFSMFQKFSNTAGVLNYVTGVMNNVQTNYDTEFADEVVFVINQHFSSTCSSCDPWSNSTDAEVLLNSFTDWGPSGFTAGHDLAGIWTNRNFDGSTIGIAWLNAVCTSIRYHALQDWGGNAAQVRCMVAHEIGHNFGANHDASGTWIMSPSVSTTNNWSPTSIGVINATIQNSGCLGNCPASGAPTAIMDYTVIETCVPGKVQYNDVSIGGTSRTWTFPGGTPSTSTLQNPLITYNSVGTYNATLVSTNNAGSNTLTIPGVITTSASAVSNFTFTISGNTVTFTYTGTTNTDKFGNLAMVQTHLKPIQYILMRQMAYIQSNVRHLTRVALIQKQSTSQ